MSRGNRLDLDANESSRWHGTERGGTDLRSASLSRSERTWASSDGGPGLNLGEQMAGRSMLGTVWEPFRGCWRAASWKRTYKPEIGRVQRGLRDFGLDATHDNGAAHAYEGRSIGRRYGPCDDGDEDGRTVMVKNTTHRR